jgi:hypothetical protein
MHLIRRLFRGGIAIAYPRPENRPMPIARITGQGLIAIAFSVALLWGCLIGERLLTSQAYSERARVMHDIRRLHRSQPVSDPHPELLRPRRFSL